jgi:hypothetical protein
MKKLFACLLIAACGGSNEGTPDAGTQRTRNPVVIISIDGLRPDAIRLAPMPTLLALAARGAYTWEGQTIRPSITLPSHTSMMTGHGPSAHGITWNDYRPVYLMESTPTVLAVARKAGMRSVLVSGKEKFATLAPPGSTGVFVWASGGDLDVAASAAAELSTPFDLALVHLPGTDDMGHAQGWMSPSYLAQVRAADAAVAHLLETLPPETRIIVTADHGGLGLNHIDDIPEDTTIPWIMVGPGVRKNYELKFDLWTTDTAATAAQLLGLSLPKTAIGRPVEEAMEGFSGTIESCGTVPNDAPVTMETAIPEEAPAPSGGTPAPGLYELTASTVYAADIVIRPQPTGRRFKASLRIERDPGGELVMETVDGSVGGPQGGPGGMTPMPTTTAMGPDRRSRFRISSTGASLERRRLCSKIVEPGSIVMDDYTATADELLFFGQLQVNRDIKLPVVSTFTRRP